MRALIVLALGCLISSGCARTTTGAGEDVSGDAGARMVGTEAMATRGDTAPPDASAGDPTGCVPTDQQNGEFDYCDGIDADCDGFIDEGHDRDGDGFPASACADPEAPSQDCGPEQPEVFPGAIELCDGLDNDCDGAWDEGLGDDCPALRCSFGPTRCPRGTVCSWVDDMCVAPAACPTVDFEESWCDWPDRNAECDPAVCNKASAGSCWAECNCAPDGRFVWAMYCTE